MNRSAERPHAPEMEEMRTLVVLAATGSFAAAAAALRRDPTAISRRLRALESRLGVRIADWTTRTFALTEAGRTYLSRVKPLLEELEAAARDASAFSSGAPRGRLRLALPGSFAKLWLDPLLVRFLDRYPDITLDACYTNRFVDLVSEGFDAAVRLGRLSDSHLLARKVATRRRLVCASPEYLLRRGTPGDPAELQGHDCLCFTGRTNPHQWDFVNANSVSVLSDCRIASDDADLLVAAAKAGLGLFYTTDWHVGPHLASGALVEVLESYPVRDEGAIYVLTPNGDRMPSKTRAFSDWISEHLEVPPWSLPATDR